MSIRTNNFSLIPALMIGLAGLAIAPVTTAQDALGSGSPATGTLKSPIATRS